MNLDAVKDICVECETLGYDAFYYGEGLGLECFTTLAYLSGITKKIRLGPGMSFISYRHPVLLAKIGATLDVLVEVDSSLGWVQVVCLVTDYHDHLLRHA